MRVILSEAKPPRQVAPSPPRYACHLSRFNGRAYSRKGEFPQNIKLKGWQNEDENKRRFLAFETPRGA